MEKKTYKDLMENQTEMREKLLTILKEEPISMRKLAQEIGIGTNTLIRFLRDENNVDFVRLVKIEKWIKKQGK